MKLAMVGLGRMGGNMARRLLKAGHTVVGFNRTEEVTRQIQKESGLTPAFSLKEVISQCVKFNFTERPTSQDVYEKLKVFFQGIN